MPRKTPGIRPDKVDLRCANCGYEYTCKHMNIAPNAKISVRCKECNSGGAVVHNRYSYVEGTYGAVSIENPEDATTDYSP